MSTTASRPTDSSPRDPWHSCYPSWLRAPGLRVDRERTAAAPQQPRLWKYVVLAADRGLLAALAREVLAAEPGIGFAFGGRLLERLRARAADASRTPAAREQARRVDVVVSRNLSDLSDLLARTRALRAEEAH